MFALILVCLTIIIVSIGSVLLILSRPKKQPKKMISLRGMDKSFDSFITAMEGLSDAKK